MSRHFKLSNRMNNSLVEVKSKIDAEFRRFSVSSSSSTFEKFQEVLVTVHQLELCPFVITYADQYGDSLPINNDDNFVKALSTAKPLLRVILQRKGESYEEINGYGSLQRRRNPIISKLVNNEPAIKPRIAISMPGNFRRVSAIIDVDVVPETHRRVKLMKNGSDKPLGFYIRDGTSVRVTPHGLEKVPGIFISRLVPGGLAESTGLLAVNDEVLEVNGIEVSGKTLDQVTDMMIANSSNLIITVKPVNQRLTLQRGGGGRHSQMSSASQNSQHSFESDIITEQDDEDEVQNHLSKIKSSGSSKSSDSNRSHHSNKSDKDSTVMTL